MPIVRALMNAQTLPAPHEAVVFQVVSDGGVLLHTGQEMYYGLNSAGVRIWQLLPTAGDFDTLCERMATSYPDVEPARLRADAEELLGDLADAGLVVARP